MKRLLIAAVIVLAASLSAEAAAAKSHSKHHTRSSNDGVTVYDKDSKDPNVGWHTENGLRVCTHDCDNPEIPGSGARCRTITFMGMRGRECDTGSW